MNAGTIAVYVQEVQVVGDQVLDTIKGLDPELALPAVTAEVVLNLVSEMVSKVLTAWSDASGVPITAASVAALLPNQTPLTAPDPA